MSQKRGGDGETSTLRGTGPFDRRAAQDLAEVTLALVVVWAAGEAGRIGEAALVSPEEGSNQKFVFGRGVSDDDLHVRLLLRRQRPNESRYTAPISNPFISRRQILIQKGEGRSLKVENVGSCKMLINGKEAEKGIIGPGDLLTLRDQLVFLCTERPAAIPAAQNYPSDRIPSFAAPDSDGIVGESPAIWKLRDQVAFVARREGDVLLLGASGTGKELVAQAIHSLSARARGPLVSRNAATLPPGLIDAELFGNTKNYPNAGMPARPGLFGAADGGTLFLDEIAELPLELQTHLLRVIDSKGEYQRLGEATTRVADVRLIAATNRPIESLRADLAARLPLQLTLPKLAERPEDIPLLTRFLLHRLAAEDRSIGERFFQDWNSDVAEPRIAPELIEALLQHRYATNVRELEQLLWKSLASSPGDHLTLTNEVREAMGAPAPSAARQSSKALPTKEEVQQSLERNQGIQERVWRELGLANRFVLQRLLKKFGL